MTRLSFEISTDCLVVSTCLSFDPFSRSYLKKHISVDGSKPVQLSVKQDGAVDVFEMQVILPARTARSDTAFATKGTTQVVQRLPTVYLVHVMCTSPVKLLIALLPYEENLRMYSYL